MINPTENQRSRFHRVREDLSTVPSSQVSTHIDPPRQNGESATATSMEDEHCRLAQSPELRPGRLLAKRYTIKEKIGEGGMGVVYEAVQELTQQEVALKIIHPTLVSPSLINRFREEIRTLGKLQHDHIVRVFDADYDRQDPPNHDLLFYAMQLVRGLPLIRWVNELHPTIEARLECFILICDAVNYAHCRGVVHRDLKPDNILVDAGGRPAILDFGLAQIMELAFEVSKDPPTFEGQSLLQVAGTPAFMSPERWEGNPGGVPADVFALGVLLHETLTGSRPWSAAPGASINDLRLAICNFSTDQLKEHPALSRPLERLVGSMLAPDPKARPASAAAVASAIRTILARRRLKRRIRHAAPIWAGIAVAVGSVIVTQSYYARLNRQQRESEYRLARASQIVGRRSQVDTLAQVIKLMPPKPELRHSQDEWRDVAMKAMATWNLRTDQAVPLPSGFEPIACSQEGTRFLGRSTAGTWEVIERADGGWVPKQFPGQYDFLRTRINPRQPQLAALTLASGLVVWQLNHEQQTKLLPAAETATQFEFSPDGRYLACSATISGPQGADGEPLSAVRVFDTETWEAVAFLFKSGDEPEPGTFIYVRSRPVAGLAFSPDGKHLAAWSAESSYLLIWEWSKEQPIRFASHPDRLAAAAWRPAPAEAEFATIQANGQIRVWKLPSAPTLGDYPGLGDHIDLGQTAPNFQGQLAWSPGGEALAAIDEVNQTMDIFAPDAGAGRFRALLGNPSNGGMRWLSGGLVRSGAGHREWVPFDSDPPVRRVLRISDFSPSHLAFNPVGTILAAADATRIVFVATTSGAILASLPMPLSGSIAFDAASGDLWAYNKTNGPTCWTVSETPGGMTYTPKTTALSGTHVGHLAAAGGHLVFSRGTNLYIPAKAGVYEIAGAFADITVGAPPQQLAISANGRRVAAIWGNPARATLWRRQMGGAWVSELATTNAPVLANLPDWNSMAPLAIRPLQQRTAEEKNFESQPTHFDNSSLLTPAAQFEMVAWLRDPGQGVHLDYLGGDLCVHVATLPFDREDDLQTAMALSPDGMRLATANSRGEIQLWDVRRALERFTDLHLGVDKIKLGKRAQSEESPKSLTIVGPG